MQTCGYYGEGNQNSATHYGKCGTSLAVSPAANTVRSDRIPWIFFWCGQLYFPVFNIAHAIYRFVAHDFERHHYQRTVTDYLVMLGLMLAFCCSCGAPFFTSASIPRKFLLSAGGVLLFGVFFFILFVIYVVFGGGFIA